MQFTTPKNEIFEVLQRVLGVVPAKTTIPILSNILFELKDDDLTILGTDLEISISSTIRVSGHLDGAVALPARIISEVIREIPDVPINFILEENDWIRIEAGKGVYRVAGQPQGDFPQVTVEKSEKEFDITAENLSRMISKTIFAISSDELRPALTGVYFEIKADEMRFVGTNGHRLARMIMKGFDFGDYERNVIVPSKTLNLLMRSLEEKKIARVQIGEDHIVFGLQNTLINSKLIDSQYPNYERVIPIDNEKRLIVNRDLLHSTLRRSIIFSSSLTHQVRFDISSTAMKITAEDIEFGGEAKEEISVQFDGEPMSIAYNAAYLIDVLRHIDTDEVIFELKHSGSAAVVYPTVQKEKENVTMLLMPMRLSEEEEEEDEQEKPDEDQEEPEDIPDYQ